jgi:hypothetical protein
VLEALSQRLRRIWFVLQRCRCAKANIVDQWPDNYNWESTRAINTPAPRKDVKDASKASNEDLSSKEKEIELEAKDASSSDDSSDTTDDGLDPVALKKAFRFASISSIALVSNFTQSRFPI